VEQAGRVEEVQAAQGDGESHESAGAILEVSGVVVVVLRAA
jgi:hypothetical protein